MGAPLQTIKVRLIDFNPTAASVRVQYNGKVRTVGRGAIHGMDVEPPDSQGNQRADITVPCWLIEKEFD